MTKSTIATMLLAAATALTSSAALAQGAVAEGPDLQAMRQWEK